MYRYLYLLFYKLIPAGAEAILNMASVLHDETIFEDPHKFLPERYLAGDVALKKQRTIPFGLGKFIKRVST